MGEQCRLRQNLEQGLKAHGLTPNGVLTVDDTESRKRYVEIGMGLGAGERLYTTRYRPPPVRSPTLRSPILEFRHRRGYPEGQVRWACDPELRRDNVETDPRLSQSRAVGRRKSSWDRFS